MSASQVVSPLGGVNYSYGKMNRQDAKDAKLFAFLGDFNVLAVNNDAQTTYLAR